MRKLNWECNTKLGIKGEVEGKKWNGGGVKCGTGDKAWHWV